MLNHSDDIRNVHVFYVDCISGGHDGYAIMLTMASVEEYYGCIVVEDVSSGCSFMHDDQQAMTQLMTPDPQPSDDDRDGDDKIPHCALRKASSYR